MGKFAWIQKVKKMKAEPLIIRLLTAYALGSLVLLLYALLRDDILFTDLSFMKSLGLAPALIVFAVFFVLLNLFALGHKQLQMERVLLFCSMTLYFMLLGYFGYQIWFFLFLCIFIGVGAWYCFGRDAISLRPKVSLSRLVPALAVVWFVFFSVQTVLRYRSFGGDNYDMGVYSQMFYQMAEGNGPLTTVANYYEKSRFVTDPSPILYLLLPLYMGFRSMTPYLILQAAALASGVVPLLLICKKRACSETTCLLSGLLYLLSAGIWTGIYYDFHEQSLLAPLLLWGLYFAERKTTAGYLIAMALSLCVGKEGLVSVGAVSLYVLFGLKQKKSGSLSLLLTALCFLLTEIFLPGVTFLATGELSESELASFLLANPGYLLKHWFSLGKAEYLVLMLLPLGALPLLCRKKASLFLLLPFFIIGFLSPNSYDGSVYYQHAFAPAALLLYLFAVHFPALQAKWKPCVAVFCAAVSLVSFSGIVLSQANYVRTYRDRQEIIPKIESCLQEVPADASVAASASLTAFLAERQVLFADYPVYQEDGTVQSSVMTYDAEWVVLDLFSFTPEINTARMAWLQSAGYEPVRIEDGAAAVFVLAETGDSGAG